MNSKRTNRFNADVYNEILQTCHANLLTIVNGRTIPDLASRNKAAFGFGEATIVANRFGKGLYSSDKSRSKTLHGDCLRRTYESDEALHRYNSGSYFAFYGDPHASSRVDRARSLIREWLEYRPRPGDVQLPPGETYISNRGRVSIYRKLKGEWTVTRECFDSFAGVVFRTRWLRRLAYERIERVTGRKMSVHYRDAFALLGKHIDQFGLFLILFARIVVIVPGSRFSSVPKDTDKRRPINVEPLGNMIVQRTYGLAIREQLKLKAGNDLQTGQEYHRLRIRDFSYATIDFSGASDSISTGLVEALFPSKWVKALMTCRSEKCDYGYNPEMFNERPNTAPDSPIFKTWARRIVSEEVQERRTANLMGAKRPKIDIEKELILTESRLRYENAVGRWKTLSKMSSMGNGFTFEVLTCVLLSVARTFDPTASAYGDDVVIKSEYAEDFMQFCERLGFEVNKNKSFWSGPLRESCGAFILDDVDVLSFEMDAVESKLDLIIQINKLGLLIRHYRARYSATKYIPLWNIVRLLTECRNRLLSVDRLYSGPFTEPRRVWNIKTDRFELEVEGRFVQQLDDEPPIRLNKKFPQAVWETIAERLKQLQLPHNRVVITASYERVDVIDSPDNARVKDIHKVASYLYAGRRVASITRTSGSDVKFRLVYIVLLPDGRVFDLNDLTHGCYCPL